MIEPAPAPALAAETVARRRFLTIQSVRLGGVAALLIGILAINDAVRVPHAVGYVLLVAGFVGFGVLPVILSKRWKSTRRAPRR